MVVDELVGRDEALARLRAAVERAGAGRGGLVLVAGEPGIGKTAVVARATEHAAEAGVGVLWATCWDGAGAPAYWPWVQVVRSYVRTCDQATLRAQVGRVPTRSRASPMMSVPLPRGCPHLQAGTWIGPGSGCSMR
jgi:predicted ATPase